MVVVVVVVMMVVVVVVVVVVVLVPATWYVPCDLVCSLFRGQKAFKASKISRHPCAATRASRVLVLILLVLGVEVEYELAGSTFSSGDSRVWHEILKQTCMWGADAQHGLGIRRLSISSV